MAKARDASIRADGPKTLAELDTVGKQIAAQEASIYLALMRDNGLEAELGGPAASEAALRALSIQFRRKVLGKEADIARFYTVAGEASFDGYLGFATAYVAATALIKGLTADVYKGADGTLAERKQQDSGASIKSDITNGVATATADFDGKIEGMDGRMAIKVKFDTCPRADGTVHISIEANSSLKSASSGTSINNKMTSNLVRIVGDDSEYIGQQAELDTRVELTSSGGAAGSNGKYIDATDMISVKGGAWGQKVNRASSRVTMREQEAAAGLAQRVTVLAYQASHAAEEIFKSGRCMTLNPTSDPVKRSGVKPKTSFAILAAPRSKIDGTPTGGSVTATLSGAGTLDPAGSKVPADANLTYVAGGKNTKGSVAFEARSKRGIGKATLAFDTGGRGYKAVGGGGDWSGSGLICSLTEPFAISGQGLTNSFTPSSGTGGSYILSGAFQGKWQSSGSGSYTVDEQGGTLKANGTGRVTMMGRALPSYPHSVTFKLTPTDECP